MRLCKHGILLSLKQFMLSLHGHHLTLECTCKPQYQIYPFITCQKTQPIRIQDCIFNGITPNLPLYTSLILLPLYLLCEALEPRQAHNCRNVSRFRSVKLLEVFLFPLDGMLVHRRSLPRNLLDFRNNSPVSICTPGWREALWEHNGPFAPELSALATRPPHLPRIYYGME